MQKWEYGVLRIKFLGEKYLFCQFGEDLEKGNYEDYKDPYALDILNKLGQDGWEVCAKSPMENVGYILKRPITTE